MKSYHAHVSGLIFAKTEFGKNVFVSKSKINLLHRNKQGISFIEILVVLNFDHP